MPDALPDFLQPRLRLFFSVDLVGSTSFKQQGQYPLADPATTEFGSLGARWFSEIATFYRSVEQHFAASWRLCGRAYEAALLGEPFNRVPELWKTNGDELIYSVVLKEPEDVGYILTAWLKALKAYRQDLKRQTDTLDIKGAAWLAGFPIGNAEVVFCPSLADGQKYQDDDDPKLYHFSLLHRSYKGKDARHGLIKDYIGPAIDTGFRIAQRATPRKFTVSFDVALMLAQAPPNHDFFCEAEITPADLELAFDGLAPLKGVLNGVPYPLFWIDLKVPDSATDAAVDAVDRLGLRNKPEKEKIIQYCNAFIDANASNVFRPFIAGSQNQHFRKAPDKYRETLRKLADRWEQEQSRLERRWDSFLSPGTDGLAMDRGRPGQDILGSVLREGLIKF